MKSRATESPRGGAALARRAARRSTSRSSTCTCRRWTASRWRGRSASATPRCRWCCSARSAGARRATPSGSSTPTSPSRSASRSCSTRWSACWRATRRPRPRRRRPSRSSIPAMAARHPLRILLAEDNVVNQKLALRLLQQMGYRADLASNGIEAVESVQRQTYDVVLMDVQMPEMDGLEAVAPDQRALAADGAAAHRRDDGQRHAGRPRDVPRRRHGRLPDQADPRRAAGRGAEPGVPHARSDDERTHDRSRDLRRAQGDRPAPSSSRELVDTFLAGGADDARRSARARSPRRMPTSSAAPRIRSSPTATRSARSTLGAMARELELGGLATRRSRADGEAARRAGAGIRARRRGADGVAPCVTCAAGAARLLVVDDNKVNRLLLTRSLELQGHSVASAENGRVALEMLRRESFDLLLLDMEMPEMDGFQVLEQLVERSAAARPAGHRHVVAGRHRQRRALHRARRRGLPHQAGQSGAAEGAHRREPREEAPARPAEGTGAPLRHAGGRAGPAEFRLLARRQARARRR